MKFLRLGIMLALLTGSMFGMDNDKKPTEGSKEEKGKQVVFNKRNTQSNFFNIATNYGPINVNNPPTGTTQDNSTSSTSSTKQKGDKDKIKLSSVVIPQLPQEVIEEILHQSTKRKLPKGKYFFKNQDGKPEKKERTTKGTNKRNFFNAFKEFEQITNQVLLSSNSTRTQGSTTPQTTTTPPTSIDAINAMHKILNNVETKQKAPDKQEAKISIRNLLNPDENKKT